MQGIAPPGHILDHLLIFALSVAAVGKGILLIHASTIRYRGKAVMFLGESGTGKSTHSRMWLENIEGSTLLNDDAPAVRISADSTTLTVLRGAVKPRVTVPNTTPWRPWSASGGPPTIKSPV